MSLVAYFERFPLFRDYVLPLIASPTRRRLASGAFWGGVGGVVSRGALLVTSFFLARILGQAQFGEYGVVNSTSAMLSAVAGLGVGTTATKYVAQLRNTDKRRTGRIISLSSMVTWISGTLYGLVFVVLAPWLAEKTLAAPHLTQVLRISSISVVLGVINGAQQCSLAGFEAFRISALVNIGGSLFQSVAVCLGAWHRFFRGRSSRQSRVERRGSTSPIATAQWLATVRVKALPGCFARKREDAKLEGQASRKPCPIIPYSLFCNGGGLDMSSLVKS
jgi:hypothetical protein